MEMNQSAQKPRAAVYLRKSSVDDQPGENRSFARQMTDISRIISEFSVVAEFQEEIGISASRFSNQERPEWDRALAGLGFDYDVLVAAQADRLDREGIGGLVKILEACEQGTKGRVITSEWDSASSEARLLGPIIFELARAESEKLHTRISAGKEVQRARHDFLGGTPPWAWDITRDDDGVAQYQIIPERQTICTDMAMRFIKGGSWAELARHGCKLGLKTNKGNDISGRTWRKILTNPSMAGHRQFDGELITDENGEPIQFADPILPSDIHAKFKVALIRNKDTRKKTGHSGTSLLVRLAKCSECGHNLVKHLDKYRCMSDHHASWSTHMGTVDDLVSMEAMKLIGSLEPGSKLSLQLAIQVRSHLNPQDRSRRSEVSGKLDDINHRLKELNKKYLVGDIDAGDFAELEDTANEKKRELVAELNELPAPIADDLADLIDWDREAGPIGEGSFWASMSYQHKRALIGSLIQTIEIDPRYITNGHTENRDEIPDRVHIEWLHESNVTELKPRKPAANTTKVAQAS
jgi:DNA invertase Pin-like site-specific DNA recombinase